MNLGEIIQRTQNLHGDTVEAQITQAMIIDWANEAQLELVRKAEVLQGSYATVSLNGTRAYAIPSDVLRIRRVEYNERRISKVSLEELDTVDSYQTSGDASGEPIYYYEWSGNIYFYPTPSENDKVISVYYLKRPTELSAVSDVPDIPEQFHPDLVRYCLSRAKEVDEEYDKAQETMNDFRMRVAETKADAAESDLGSYPAVRALEGDLGYGW